MRGKGKRGEYDGNCEEEETRDIGDSSSNGESVACAIRISGLSVSKVVYVTGYSLINYVHVVRRDPRKRIRNAASSCRSSGKIVDIWHLGRRNHRSGLTSLGLSTCHLASSIGGQSQKET